MPNSHIHYDSDGYADGRADRDANRVSDAYTAYGNRYGHHYTHGYIYEYQDAYHRGYRDEHSKPLRQPISIHYGDGSTDQYGYLVARIGNAKIHLDPKLNWNLDANGLNTTEPYSIWADDHDTYIETIEHAAAHRH